VQFSISFAIKKTSDGESLPMHAGLGGVLRNGVDDDG
jgi:hypothetical protein